MEPDDVMIDHLATPPMTARGVLDQRTDGYCTAFAFTTALMAAGASEFPRGRSPETFARWLANSTPNPRSIAVTARRLRTLGIIAQVSWLRTTADIAAAVKTDGPVVASLRWPTSALRTSDPVLPAAGPYHPRRHSVAIVDYHADRFTVRNTWGTQWGAGGEAHIDAADLEVLLGEIRPRLICLPHLTPTGGS
jgi:C1A family cysteine protease